MISHPAMVVLPLAALSILLSELPIGIRLPPILLEMLFGVIVGPQVLALAAPEPQLEWLGGVAGLGLLFFMAGLEIDLGRFKGRSISLAASGWVLSLVLGVIFAEILHLLPHVHAPLMIGLALTTTPLALLSPILRDAGELNSSFGRAVLAAGVAGEFGPIVAMSLVLQPAHSTWEQIGLMLVLAAIVFSSARIALGYRSPKLLALLKRTMHSSAQLPVLLSLLFLAAVANLAWSFGLEPILGEFAAGMVVGLATRGEEGQPLREKIEAITYGLFIPFFFVVSGMNFDLRALMGSVQSVSFVPLFLILFLVVRGAPVLLYRDDLSPEERVPFVLYTSMGLPVVLAITHIGVTSGKMTASTAASLNAAGLLSVLIFPTLAAAFRTQAESNHPAQPS